MDSSESFNSDPFSFAGTKRKKVNSPSQKRTFRSPARSKVKKSPNRVKTGRVNKVGKNVTQRRGSLFPSQSQSQHPDITGVKGNDCSYSSDIS